jgi:hypothetical protein
MNSIFSPGLNGSQFTRRRFLRGMGAALALPMFESLMPRKAFAAKLSRAATTASGMPIRTGFFYHPNGVNLKLWHPTGAGKDFQLGKTHEPLAAFKNKLQVVANLDHDCAVARYTTPDGRVLNDGGGDHARAPGVWLTGTRVAKSEKDIHAGVSIDQVLAQRIGAFTRFPSLELISDGSRKTGNCDNGYSCEYEYNISWRSATTPNPPEPNPRLVFERLFGAGSPAERAASLTMRKEQRRSVLDFALDDAKMLSRDLGLADKQKLDEYLTSVREVEQRISKVETFGAVPDLGVEAPSGTPGDFGDRIDILLEMMYLAFVTDSTRVASIILARDGDDRTFTWLGHKGGHHSTSHYKNNENRSGNTPEQNHAWLGEIEYWYMQRFAKFIKKLDDAKDADGSSVLDNSVLIYGAGNSDSNSHTHYNLPTLVVGGGGGALNPGRYVNAQPLRDPLLPPTNRGGNGALPGQKGVPMSNFFVGLAEKLGVEGVERFGDSTGRFTDI